MNKKEMTFWALAALLIFYFFLAFGVFLFQRQEEGQLFIPAWWNIREQFLQAGGFCTVTGQLVIQYYRMPMLGIFIHTLLLTGIGLAVYKLLQSFSSKYYHLPLALFPVLLLLKMSIRGNYLVDGTIGLFLMALALLPLLWIRQRRTIAAYGIVSTVLLFGLAGVLSVCYSVIYSVISAIRYTENRSRVSALWSLIPAGLFCCFSRQFGIPVPLWEGFRPEEYLDIQLQPHYYIYYVWILFSALLIGTLLVGYLLARIRINARWLQVGLTTVCTLGVVAFGNYCMPDKWDIQNRMVDELSYLAREEQWDTIIDRYKGREIKDYISLNYLNMALAQQGKLADSLFSFDQRGAKSLVAPWNQSLFMDKLLCDVHFMIGDLGMAESYAMDAMTQSKRGGSARMLQRLVQINLIKGEKKLVRKYLDLLEAMPFYKEWAMEQYIYLEVPTTMHENAELRGKFMPAADSDRLYSLMTTDSLWGVYEPWSIGWEYLGCYYLLDKKLEKFRVFIEQSGETELPRHFQEAWLMLEIQSGDAPAVSPNIHTDIVKRYRQFKKILAVRSASDVNMQEVYREFGDTYWFYYYFKLFKNQEMTQ